MRLLTALWVPAEAASALAAEIAGPADARPADVAGSVGVAGPAGVTRPGADAGPPAGWRHVEPAAWHLTLASHGEADPGVLARRLDAAARGAPAPRLRLAGAGSSPGRCWAGIEPEPVDGLAGPAGLVETAGGDRAGFVAHVTVLRRRSRPGAGAVARPPTPWAAHRGPWWRPAEVLLVASEPGRAGPRYRVVHRVPLAVPGLPGAPPDAPARGVPSEWVARPARHRPW